MLLHLLLTCPAAALPLLQGYDLPWWEKIMGLRFRDGRLQLKGLTGGKMDDITVLVACVEEEEEQRQQPVAAAAEGQAEAAEGAAEAAAAPLAAQQQDASAGSS